MTFSSLKARLVFALIKIIVSAVKNSRFCSGKVFFFCLKKIKKSCIFFGTSIIITVNYATEKYFSLKNLILLFRIRFILVETNLSKKLPNYFFLCSFKCEFFIIFEKFLQPCACFNEYKVNLEKKLNF